MSSNGWVAAAEVARAQGGVILGSQARQVSGVVDLRRLARGARHPPDKMWHGTYALQQRQEMSLADRLRGADLTLDRPVVPCLDTAAALHGFDLSGDRRLHLLADADAASKRTQIVTHRITPTSPLSTVGGRWVMDSAETAIRVAARQRLEPESLAVLDAAIAAHGGPSVSSLNTCANELHINGIQRVRRLIDWADGRAESPRESWLRWAVLDGGLPPPKLQFWVTMRSGVRYRLDLAWPQHKVACEYDGEEFHTGDALPRDRARINDITCDGWLMAFATKSMTMSTRHRVVLQMADLLRRRGAEF